MYYGNKKAFNSLKNRLISDKETFEIKSFGAKFQLRYSKRTYHFYNKSKKNDIAIACSELIRTVNRWKKYYDINFLDIKKTQTYFKNEHLLENVVKNEKTIYAIDVNACYWSILKNKGIINKKLYSKYRKNKKLRLVAVGNLAKKRYTKKYFNGFEDKSKFEVTENENRFAWDYVVSETWKLFLELNHQLSYNIFLFKTDCFYVTEDFVDSVCIFLENKNLKYTVEELTNLQFNENKKQIKCYSETSKRVKNLI